LTSFNSWFALHPEKICGIEYVTTSREFPIAVNGSDEDIYQTIHKEENSEKPKRLRVAKAKAKAILLLAI